MNYVLCIKSALLPVILFTFIGCKSKQDKPVIDAAAAPQEKAAATAVPPQAKAVASAVLSQDKTEARIAAARVLSLMESGDFSPIYKDSAAGFKQIGSESQFVAKFEQTRKRVGAIKKPLEISFGTLPGNGYVFTYRLENEHYITDLRLTFARSQSGKMELAGLNQHDELKK